MWTRDEVIGICAHRNRRGRGDNLGISVSRSVEQKQREQRK